MFAMFTIVQVKLSQIKNTITIIVKIILMKQNTKINYLIVNVTNMFFINFTVVGAQTLAFCLVHHHHCCHLTSAIVVYPSRSFHFLMPSILWYFKNSHLNVNSRGSQTKKGAQTLAFCLVHHHHCRHLTSGCKFPFLWFTLQEVFTLSNIFLMEIQEFTHTFDFKHLSKRLPN